MKTLQRERVGYTFQAFVASRKIVLLFCAFGKKRKNHIIKKKERKMVCLKHPKKQLEHFISKKQKDLSSLALKMAEVIDIK